MSQEKANHNPTLPMTFPHRRLRELVREWTEVGKIPIDDLLASVFSLREYVSTFHKRASEPTGIPESELIYEGMRLAFSLHLQACDLLLKAMMEERMEDAAQVLELAVFGDVAGDEADQEAERIRETEGYLG